MDKIFNELKAHILFSFLGDDINGRFKSKPSTFKIKDIKWEDRTLCDDLSVDDDVVVHSETYAFPNLMEGDVIKLHDMLCYDSDLNDYSELDYHLSVENKTIVVSCFTD